jgi:hypothetical protein
MQQPRVGALEQDAQSKQFSGDVFFPLETNPEALELRKEEKLYLDQFRGEGP